MLLSFYTAVHTHISHYNAYMRCVSYVRAFLKLFHHIKLSCVCVYLPFKNFHDENVEFIILKTFEKQPRIAH